MAVLRSLRVAAHSWSLIHFLVSAWKTTTRFFQKNLICSSRFARTRTSTGRQAPRAAHGQALPSPAAKSAADWIGVGGTPESFARAGMLGLPSWSPSSWRTQTIPPLIDLYREAGRRAGHSADNSSWVFTPSAFWETRPAGCGRLLSWIRAHVHRDRQGTRLAPNYAGKVRRRTRTHRCAVDRRRRNCRGENTIRE